MKTPATEESTEVSTSATVRVGRRLTQIRKELGRAHGDQEWSQTAVGGRTGLTQNVIARMENGKGGLFENWLRLLGLYETQGYNLNWILTEKNGMMGKMLLHEATDSYLRANVLRKMETIKQHQKKLTEELTELEQMMDEKKGDGEAESSFPSMASDEDMLTGDWFEEVK